MEELTKSEKKRLNRELRKLEKAEKLLKEQNDQRRKDERFMKVALQQAKKAFQLGEVPIGCVIVRDDQIIARSSNKRNTKKNALAHAEVMAINKACKYVNDWRLDECTMYITLEPCPMCAGAIVQSRMKRVVIGAMSPKAGFAGSVLNILQLDSLNHKVLLETEILKDECAAILSDFFVELRENGKEKEKK